MKSKKSFVSIALLIVLSCKGYNTKDIALVKNRASKAYAGIANKDIGWANGKTADLYGADLPGANLSGINLENADLYVADLRGASLKKANLKNANLASAWLINADLSGADLTGADLRGSNLKLANLIGAKLENANLTDANLTAACMSYPEKGFYEVVIFKNTNMTNIQAGATVCIRPNPNDLALVKNRKSKVYQPGIANEDIGWANGRYADLRYADLSGENLKGANLERANLEGAFLQGTHLEGADLEGTNLKGAFLQGSHLQGANFTGASLFGADLINAKLEKANLTDADLTLACMSYPGKNFYLVVTFKNTNMTNIQTGVTVCVRPNPNDLALVTNRKSKVYQPGITNKEIGWTNGKSANLRYADLEGANLEGAFLQGADLTGAHLEGADLTGAFLENANLASAWLKNANLTGANLELANLIGAELENANLTDADLTLACMSYPKEGFSTVVSSLEGAKLDARWNVTSCPVFETKPVNKPPSFIHGEQQDDKLIGRVKDGETVESVMPYFNNSFYLKILRQVEKSLSAFDSNIAKETQFQTSIDQDPTVIFTNIILKKVAAKTVTEERADTLLNAAPLKAEDRPASLSGFTSITYPQRVISDRNYYKKKISSLKSGT